MRIKHWAGYGTVTATKVSDHTYKWNHRRQIKVRVTGNHEMGLTRTFYDPSCIWHWLGKRFVKGKTYADFAEYMVLENGYARNNGVDEEYAVYLLVYKDM